MLKKKGKYIKMIEVRCSSVLYIVFWDLYKGKGILPKSINYPNNLYSGILYNM